MGEVIVRGSTRTLRVLLTMTNSEIVILSSAEGACRRTH
jgi:hypothetical protein